MTVMIDTNGQLGTISSSRRFKEDIQDMGDASSSLMRLRPVTYRYKQPYADGSKPLDYGLIAEEVAEVYPDLVVTNKDGQVQTVQYQKLTPMLLNELQKQNQHTQQQDETIRQQQEQNRQQQEQIRKLEARLAALEAMLSGKAPTTATAGQ
jgi:TolA-binding protein